MNIDLDNLEVCGGCGILYDISITLQKSNRPYNTGYWDGKCPLCDAKQRVYET